MLRVGARCASLRDGGREKNPFLVFSLQRMAFNDVPKSNEAHLEERSCLASSPGAGGQVVHGRDFNEGGREEFRFRADLTHQRLRGVDRSDDESRRMSGKMTSRRREACCTCSCLFLLKCFSDHVA